MRNFQAEMKRLIDKRHSDEHPLVPSPTEKLFNIHKRSLPVGIDKIVMWNVTKAQANWLIEKRLKARVYHDDVKETKTLIYYDAIPNGALPRERSVYFNTRPVSIE